MEILMVEDNWEDAKTSQLRHRSSPHEGELLRLLLIEDNPVDACVIRECLASTDEVSIELEHVRQLSTGLSRLKDGRFHAVVADLNLSDSEGIDTVIRIHAFDPRIPIVVLTGVDEKLVALQVVRAGAEDYLCKNDLEPKLLVRTIRYAVERVAHRQAKEQFKGEEQRYRRLLEAITSYTYSVTFDNGASFTRHGLGCLATTGYSPDEYAADYYLWIRIVHPDDREKVTQYVARILTGEKLSPIEHRILHKDGSTLWIRNTIIHRYDERGRLSGYDGVVEDITERKRAEEALGASEKKYRGLFEGSRDAIMTVEPPSWRFTSGNPATVQMFGVKNEEEFISLSPWELSPERQPDGRDSVEKAKEMIETAVRAGSYRFEWTHQRIDGAEFFADVLLARMERDGKVVVQAMVRDITEQKRAEEALRASKESLREREAYLLAAAAIQARLWPKAPPALPGFDIAGAAYPAEFAAGDYFDYVPLADGSLGFVIADVSGHGLGPGIVMALTYAHMRSLATIYSEPTEILTRLNRFLIDETDPFVTLLFGRLIPNTKSFVGVNAGHPPGYVLDSSGHIKAQIGSTTLPLAVLSDAAFPPWEPVTLDPGDIVLLFTDGIPEASSPEGAFFGNGRMLEVVCANRDRPAVEIIEAIYLAVQEFCRPGKPLDDITAIVIKIGPEAEALVQG
jgi:sigma-B regulation protein RsbU (phosphoserine phosphatase)